MALSKQESVVRNAQISPGAGAIPHIPSSPVVTVSGLKVPSFINIEWVEGMKSMEWRSDDI